MTKSVPYTRLTARTRGSEKAQQQCLASLFSDQIERDGATQHTNTKRNGKRSDGKYRVAAKVAAEGMRDGEQK